MSNPSDLEVRMKALEHTTRSFLPSRTYTIIRIDGKAFHTFTRHLERPTSSQLVESLNYAAIRLCGEMMGARLAYVQSDEASFLLTDFERESTEPWFNGNIQKIVSVSASIFTAHFNAEFNHPRRVIGDPLKPAMFDSRVFTVQSRTEVSNYFIWRQQDACRNSLNMLASCHFSHKELMHQGNNAKLEMLLTKAVDWHDQPPAFKFGRCIVKKQRERAVTWTHKKTKEVTVTDVLESYWDVDNDIPIFTDSPSYLDGFIP